MSPDSKLALDQAERISRDIDTLLQSLGESVDVNQNALKVARYHLTIGCVQLYKAIRGQHDELC